MGNAQTTTFSFTSVEAALAAGHTQEEIDEFLKDNPDVAKALARTHDEALLSAHIKGPFVNFPKEGKFEDVFVKGAYVVRASGNPMDEKVFKDLMESSDLVMGPSEVVDIHRLRLLTPDHSVGLVVFTVRQNFTYKGEKNDDVCVYSATCVKTPKGWRVTHAQRSTGRKAEEALPDFAAMEE